MLTSELKEEIETREELPQDIKEILSRFWIDSFDKIGIDDFLVKAIRYTEKRYKNKKIDWNRDSEPLRNLRSDIETVTKYFLNSPDSKIAEKITEDIIERKIPASILENQEKEDEGLILKAFEDIEGLKARFSSKKNLTTLLRTKMESLKFMAKKEKTKDDLNELFANIKPSKNQRNRKSEIPAEEFQGLVYKFFLEALSSIKIPEWETETSTEEQLYKIIKKAHIEGKILGIEITDKEIKEKFDTLRQYSEISAKQREEERLEKNTLEAEDESIDFEITALSQDPEEEKRNEEWIKKLLEEKQENKTAKQELDNKINPVELGKYFWKNPWKLHLSEEYTQERPFDFNMKSLFKQTENEEWIKKLLDEKQENKTAKQELDNKINPVELGEYFWKNPWKLHLSEEYTQERPFDFNMKSLFKQTENEESENKGENQNKKAEENPWRNEIDGLWEQIDEKKQNEKTENEFMLSKDEVINLEIATIEEVMNKLQEQNTALSFELRAETLKTNTEEWMKRLSSKAGQSLVISSYVKIIHKMLEHEVLEMKRELFSHRIWPKMMKDMVNFMSSHLVFIKNNNELVSNEGKEYVEKIIELTQEKIKFSEKRKSNRLLIWAVINSKRSLEQKIATLKKYQEEIVRQKWVLDFTTKREINKAIEGLQNSEKQENEEIYDIDLWVNEFYQIREKVEKEITNEQKEFQKKETEKEPQKENKQEKAETKQEKAKSKVDGKEEKVEEKTNKKKSFADSMKAKFKNIFKKKETETEDIVEESTETKVWDIEINSNTSTLELFDVVNKNSHLINWESLEKLFSIFSVNENNKLKKVWVEILIKKIDEGKFKLNSSWLNSDILCNILKIYTDCWWDTVTKSGYEAIAKMTKNTWTTEDIAKIKDILKVLKVNIRATNIWESDVLDSSIKILEEV